MDLKAKENNGMLTCDTQSLTTNGLTDFPIVGPS
jgi:hypothetical protein